nr:MAG TPA: hypothetical protein [Caudoviricetes sp.]
MDHIRTAHRLPPKRVFGQMYTNFFTPTKF